jgi:hypothetical protein
MSIRFIWEIQTTTRFVHTGYAAAENNFTTPTSKTLNDEKYKTNLKFHLYLCVLIQREGRKWKDLYAQL